jgi:hypothetical protein
LLFFRTKKNGKEAFTPNHPAAHNIQVGLFPPLSPPTQCDEKTNVQPEKKKEVGHHQGQNERPVSLLTYI